MSDLALLPNIGSGLVTRLEAAGISSREDLVALGSVKATLKVDAGDRGACYSLLFALEGAIRGRRWHSIPTGERTLLKQAYDKARHRARSNPDSC